MPPPARAISSYGTPVTFCSYSCARQPANGRWVWQSTKPGSSAQPLASTWMFASGSGSSDGDAAVLDGDTAGLERDLAGAVAAQILQAGLRGQEHLGGVVEGDHSDAGSSIGIRSPCSRAADTARS